YLVRRDVIILNDLLLFCHRFFFFFFFQAEDGIRDKLVTGVQTCALPISFSASSSKRAEAGSSAIHGKRPVVMSGNGRRARGSKCVLRNKARVENPGCRPHPRRKSLPARQPFPTWAPCATSARGRSSGAPPR